LKRGIGLNINRLAMDNFPGPEIGGRKLKLGLENRNTSTLKRKEKKKMNLTENSAKILFSVHVILSLNLLPRIYLRRNILSIN
jgi:hypothetical protein